MSFGGIKRDQTDDLFSKLVRERANWTCECTGVYFPEDRRQALHCAHVFGRRHKATRWNSLNAVSLSAARHLYYTENPVEFVEWVKDHYEKTYGPYAFETLRELHNRIMKVTKADKREMNKHFRAELKRMQELRNQGEQGRIEFEDFL